MATNTNNSFKFSLKGDENAAPATLSPPSIKKVDQKEKTTPGRTVINPDDSRSPRGNLGKTPVMAGRMSRLDMFLNSPDRQSVGSPPNSPPAVTSQEPVSSTVPKQQETREPAPQQRKIARAKRSKTNLLNEEPAKDDITGVEAP